MESCDEVVGSTNTTIGVIGGKKKPLIDDLKALGLLRSQFAKNFALLMSKRQQSQSLKSAKNPDDPLKIYYPSKVIYRAEGFDKFLDEGGRRFVYLTSVGQGYHKAPDFTSQFSIIIDLIEKQLECDRAILAESYKARGPFEVSILIADSLQAYSYSEKNNEHQSDKIKLNEAGQCLKIKKHPLHTKEATDAGNEFWREVGPIFHGMIEKIKKKFGNDVIIYKIIRWSENIDTTLHSNVKYDEVINNPLQYPFEAVMCRLEAHLKIGLKGLAGSELPDNYPMDTLLNNFWSLRYVLEEAVALFWKIYPEVFPKSHPSNSTIYHGYPAEVAEIFNTLMTMVDICCQELGFKYQRPVTTLLQFINCTNDRDITIPLADASSRKNVLRWKYRHLGLTSYNSKMIQISIMKKQQKEACDTAAYLDRLKTERFKARYEVVDNKNRLLETRLADCHALLINASKRKTEDLIPSEAEFRLSYSEYETQLTAYPGGKFMSFEEYILKKPFIDAVAMAYEELKKNQIPGIFGYFVSKTRIQDLKAYKELLKKIKSPLASHSTPNCAKVIAYFLCKRCDRMAQIDRHLMKELSHAMGVDYEDLTRKATQKSQDARAKCQRPIEINMYRERIFLDVRKEHEALYCFFRAAFEVRYYRNSLPTVVGYSYSGT